MPILLKTPRFWNGNTLVSTLLLPLSGLYWLGSRLRECCTQPVTLPVPVICVGNLTVGGAGKTPVALHIGEWLKERGVNAFFISHGYGGSQREPLRVDTTQHTARQVGDEPLLLAQVLPTIVGKDRLATARFAIAQGAEVLVMDDGFQNPTLHKTLSFIVVDRRLSFGNERLFPAGPLRESVRRGIRRAQAIIIINPANFIPTTLPDIPFLMARSQPHASMLALQGKPVLAFCGIAHPQKFYDMLQTAGAQIVATRSFADHHHYSESEWQALAQEAAQHKAVLVTTSKDATRLPEHFRSQVSVAEMELHFDHPEALELWLKGALNGAQS